MEKDFNIKIKANIDAINASKSIGELRKNLIELQSLSENLDIGSEAFKEVNEALTVGSLKMADLKERMEEFKDKVSTLRGEPIERMTSSFSLLKESILTLNFNKAKIAIDGLTNAFVPLNANGEVIKGLKGIPGVVNNITGTFMSLGKTVVNIGRQLLSNPIFLLAAAITGVIAVIGVLLNKLGLLTPILDGIKKALDFVIQGFYKLTDWIGLTDKKTEEYVKNELKRLDKIAEENKRYFELRISLYDKIKNMTEEEIKMIEKKHKIDLGYYKSLEDLKIDEIRMENKNLRDKEKVLILKKELTEEEKKMLDDLRKKMEENRQIIEKIEIEKSLKIQEIAKKTASVLEEIDIKTTKNSVDRNIKEVERRRLNEIRMLEEQIMEHKRYNLDYSKLLEAKKRLEIHYNNEVLKVKKEGYKKDLDASKNRFFELIKQEEMIGEIALLKSKDNKLKSLEIKLENINKLMDMYQSLGRKYGLDAIEIEKNLLKLEKEKSDIIREIKDINDKNHLINIEIEVLKSRGIERERNMLNLIKERGRIEVENAKTEEEAKMIRLKYDEDIEKQEKKIIELENNRILLLIQNDILKKQGVERLEAELELLKKEADIATKNAETIEERENIQLQYKQKILDKEKEIINFKKDSELYEYERIQNLFDNEYLYLNEIKMVKIKYLEEMMNIELQNMELTENEKANIYKKYADLREEIEIEHKNKIMELNRLEFDESLRVYNNTLNAFSALTDAVFSIKKSGLEKGSREELKAAKREFNLRKSMSIASAIMSTIEGVVNALSAKTLIPEPIGSILKAANAVAVGIAGAANVAKIASQKFDGTGGGSVNANVPSLGNGIVANNSDSINNQFIPPSLFAINSNNNNNTNNNWQKVYVVESDITNSQNKVKVIEERSRL